MRFLIPLFLLAMMPMMALADPFAKAGTAESSLAREASAQSNKNPTDDLAREAIRIAARTPVVIRKSFTLPSPPRAVIDMARIEAAGLTIPQRFEGPLVKAVRFGQFDATTSRLVLDLHAPATIETVSNGATLVIALRATKPEDRAAAAVKEKPKPLIMIDPGHGGQDPGAIGRHGTREKEVTLNYARELARALAASGRYRAALTREDDRFIPLPERVALARKKKADMFISLHADSNPKPEAQGLSIYTLSETASDDEAAALAEHENKADIIPGIDLNGADADVASILIDLTQRETMNKSAIFADAVVASLHGRVNKLPKTHRFAGFRVLKAPDIPSILIELGFLSNEADERLLLTPEYREQVVASIVKGIDRFYAAE